MDNKENDKIEQPETQKKEKEKDKKKYLLKLPNFFREITNSYTFSTKFYHNCHF